MVRNDTSVFVLYCCGGCRSRGLWRRLVSGHPDGGYFEASVDDHTCQLPTKPASSQAHISTKSTYYNGLLYIKKSARVSLINGWITAHRLLASLKLGWIITLTSISTTHTLYPVQKKTAELTVCYFSTWTCGVKQFRSHTQHLHDYIGNISSSGSRFIRHSKYTRYKYEIHTFNNTIIR